MNTGQETSASSPLAQLKALHASGDFHHATYRCERTLWEGLWFYRNYEGLRGYEPAGCIPKDSPELDEAYSYLMSHGIGTSRGSYGNG